MPAFLLPIAAFFRSSWRWLAICAAVAALGYLKGCSDGRAHVEAKYAGIALKQAENARKADSVSADQRAADVEAQRKNEDARNEAIAANPDDPYRALACQRLRASGQHAAAAKARCGSSNGSEADPAR